MGNPRKDQPFVCNVCNVIFGSGLALARHLQSHTPLVLYAPIKPWYLSEGDKAFLRGMKIAAD